MSESPAGVISFDDFVKVKMRVGKVLEACEHPNADKLLVLKVDIGEQQQRQIVAGIKGHYSPETLIGKRIVVVTNLAPRMMRGQESQGMLLAASTPEHDKVILLTTDADIEPGSAVS